MSITDEALWEGLEECSLFRGLKGHEIQDLLGGGSGGIRTHARGSLIAQAGDEVLSLQILLQVRPTHRRTLRLRVNHTAFAMHVFVCHAP